MDRAQAAHIAKLIHLGQTRVRMSRELVDKTRELIVRRAKARLREATRYLSPQDRQYAALRSWVDRQNNL